MYCFYNDSDGGGSADTDEDSLLDRNSETAITANHIYPETLSFDILDPQSQPHQAACYG